MGVQSTMALISSIRLMARFFSIEGDSDSVGKGEIDFHVFEAHGILPRVSFMDELWQENV